MNPPFTTTATSHQLPLSLTTTSPNNNHSSNSNPHYRTCSRVWLVRGFQFLCLVQWVVLTQWGGPLLSSPLGGGAAARSLTTTTTTITQKAMQEMTTTIADVAVETLPQSEQPQHVAPLPPTTTTTTPRPKRWAIMMMGGARTYAFARESFWKNFLGQTDLEYDIFSYSFFHSAADTCHIDTLGLHLWELDSTVMHIDDGFTKYPGTSKNASYDRFVRQQGQHWQVLETYAAAAHDDNVYDYVFYTRPDLIYTAPFNLTLLEHELQTRGPGQWFTPLCCKFKGLCDRMAAMHFTDFKHMVAQSAAFYKQATHKVGERLWKERAYFANLTQHFDLPADAYSFATLRHNNTRSLCHGLDWNHGGWHNGWPDTVCLRGQQNRDVARHIETLSPIACKVLDQSDCADDRR